MRKPVFWIMEGYLKEVSVTTTGKFSRWETELEPTLPFKIALSGQDAILFVRVKQDPQKRFPGLSSLIDVSKNQKRLSAIVMLSTCRFDISKIAGRLKTTIDLSTVKATRQKVRIWLSEQNLREVVRLDVI